MKTWVSIAAIVALCGTASAQWLDDFNRPDGPLDGNWTALNGTWAISGSQGAHTTGAISASLEHNLASMPYRDSVSSLDVFCPGSTLQYSGVLIGLDGTDSILVKLQDQDAVPGFSHIGIYHGSGANWNAWAGTGTGFAALTAPFLSGRLTVFFSDADTLVAEIDTNFDGVADQSYTKTGVSALTPNLGDRFGIGCFGAAAVFDNWRVVANQWSDGFNRPNGAMGSNWTAVSGTWAIAGNQGTHTSSPPSEVLQYNLAGAYYRNSVTSLDVYAPGSASQFSGVLIGLGGTDTIMVKIQDQVSGTAGFSNIGIYHGSGSSWGAWAGVGTGFANLTAPFVAGRLTVSFSDADTLVAEIDTDFNGTADQIYTKTGVSALVPNLGTRFGVTAWGTTALFDNFRVSTSRWTDRFNRADGAIGGDWTVLSGTWAIASNQGTHTSGPAYEILQHNFASVPYRTSVTTLDVFAPGTGSQFSAVLIGMGGSDTILVKIQDQDPGTAGFSNIGIYHKVSATGWSTWAGTGTGFANLTAPFLAGRLTVYFSDADTLVAEIDTDFNGVPDQIYTKTGVTTIAANLGTGLGLSAWGSTAAFDNWTATGGPTSIHTYCTAGTTTSGCNASIVSTGLPSASAGSGFTLHVVNVEGGQTGIVFYGLSPLATPWGAGSSFLCVKSPLERTGVQSVGGAFGSCNGAMSIDWNAYIASNPLAVGNPFIGGETVYAQGWFRDPPAPKTTSLSNALQFIVAP